MRIAVFSAHHYDKTSLEEANKELKHEIVYHEAALNKLTVPLTSGFEAICVFVNDEVDAQVLIELGKRGVRLVALRCAGFNNVDLHAAKENSITVVRVPAYSPHAIAEFTAALLLAVNRHLCRAWTRVREDNFTLDGLLGFDLYGKTVGVIGTGRIGSLVARAFKLGFGCNVIANDIYPNAEVQRLGISYVDRQKIFTDSDIITLHCPLTQETQHLIDRDTLSLCKKGVILINTSRGKLVDTAALVSAIETGRVGGCGIDVYEDETKLFFRDLSNDVVRDDTFQRLITFPNVVVTGHQAFFTREALRSIAHTTLKNVTDFERGHVEEEVLL